MKTILTLQVRDLKTDWNHLTIGRVQKQNKTYILTNATSETIWKANSIEKIASAGRHFAETQGYTDGAFAQAI